MKSGKDITEILNIWFEIEDSDSIEGEQSISSSAFIVLEFMIESVIMICD